MCEASFTHSRNDESGDFNEEETDEKGLQESANGVQFSSTINTMEIPADLYLSKEMGLSQINVAKLMELVAEEDAGKVRYLGVLDYGTRIKVAGWYSNEDDNPQQLLKPKYAESETYTKQNVRNCRRLMKDIPEGKYIQFNCSINSTIKKRDKITINDIVDRMEQAGTTTDTISFGGVSINIPKNFAVCKAGRHEFKMKTVWLNQGYNFDCDSIKEKKSPLTNLGQSYWEGNGVQNYTTLSELVYDKITL